MKALVLAAGKGVRLKPLTDNMPKAMVLLKGKPLLGHVLESLKKAGIKEAVIVVGYLKGKITGFFGNEFQGMKIEYIEQKEQLGNAHAIGLARKLLKGKFLVAYTDVICGPENWKMLMGKKGFDSVVALRKEKHAENFGAVEVRGNRVVSIEEKHKKPKSNLVLAGFYLFTKEIFGEIEKTRPSMRGELEITDAMEALAKRGKMGFVMSKGKILDIGSLKDLKNAEEDS